MKNKINNKSPFVIGCSFQRVSPSLVKEIKQRFRREGYRIQTVSKATSKKELYSYRLIIEFTDYSLEQDEEFEKKCLDSGRLPPFTQTISDEETPERFSKDAILENLLSEIDALCYVYVASAIFKDNPAFVETATQVQKKARRRVEKDGFVVLNPIETDEEALLREAEVKALYAPLMVFAYQNKKDFDFLMAYYQDEDSFFDRFQRAASFLYVGRGGIPLYALMTDINHYDPHQLEDALQALDRRR